MNLIIISSFVLIIFFSLKNSIKKDIRSYSVDKFVWVYIVVFWGAIPLIQYFSKSYPWGVVVGDINALKANSFILLWIGVYYFVYKKINKDQVVVFPDSLKPFKISIIGVVFLISIQIGIFVFFLLHNGFIVFLRGETVGMDFIGGSRSIHLILNQVLRAISVFISIILILEYILSKCFERYFFLIISLCILILTNFPLSIPRYMAGSFYLALIFLCKSNFKRKNTVVIGLFLLLLFVYPMFSVFRYLVSFSDYNYIATGLKVFLSGDFDNYSTLNMTINYVEKNGITFGHQLLGVVLFFFPRSVWLNKPVGSGAFVADNRFMDFTNISCPLVAEGYINFGVLGIILSAVVFAYVVANFDVKFYRYSKLTFVKLFYPVFLGLVFFVLRGDLMSSFAYSVSFAVAAFVVLIFVKPFIRYY
jgi:hypothetical protein